MRRNQVPASAKSPGIPLVTPNRAPKRLVGRSPEFPSVFANIYALVRTVPRGKIVTYGQIARALGMPHGARTVGWAMRACPDDVPWHRVVNARGEISVRPTAGFHEQRARLRGEGVRFSPAGKIDLEKYGWSHI